MAKKSLDVIVVGGSLAGLMCGIVLKRLGHNVSILERNPTPLLHHQGAGIVAGGDTQAFFERFDRTRTPIAVPSRERRYLSRDGSILHHEHYEQRMTSWDLLYYLLRANFDGLNSEYVEKVPEPERHDGEAKYDYGHKVTEVREKGEKLEVDWECTKPEPDTAEQDEAGTMTGDLLIGADGPSSSIRQVLLPSIERTYVNYVAFRGTVPESSASLDTKSMFVEKFCFYSTQGQTESTQILAYVIPGPNGTLEPGKRLINWVWYCTCKATSPQWDDWFTDMDGEKHRFTLPVGKMQPEVWEAQKACAREVLPPQFAQLVETTEHPFIQAITDVLSPQNRFFNGKCILVGDALAGFRPHTAASTSQAAYDAMMLDEMMREDAAGKEKKMSEMMEFANDMQRHGQRLGNGVMPHLNPTGNRSPIRVDESAAR